VAECTKLEERIQSLLCIEAPKAGEVRDHRPRSAARLAASVARAS
jgi:hypothetical protein